MRRTVLISLSVLLLAPSAWAAGEQPTAYAATIEPDRALIDMVRFQPGEESAVRKLTVTHTAAEGAAFAVVSPDNPILPRRFKVGDRFVLVTTGGAVEAKLTGFGVYGETLEHHLVLVLTSPGKAHVGDALAVPWSKEALRLKLRNAKPKRLSGGAAGKAVAAVQERLSPPERLLLATKPLTGEHLAAVKGRFSRGHGRLIAVRRPFSPHDQVSALFFLDRRGGMGEVIRAPRIRSAHFRARYLVDLDRDGVDEIVYDADGPEAHYRRILWWDGTSFTDSVLTGDGL